MSKKKIQKKQLPDYRYLLLWIAILFTGNLSFTKYKVSLRRLYDAVKDIILSIGYYFIEIFTPFEDVITPTVNTFPDIRLEDIFPWNWEEIARKLSQMWEYLFTEECFISYLIKIANLTHDISFFIMFFLPIILLGGYWLKTMLLSPGKAHGEDTKPFRIFKKIVRNPFLAVKAWVLSFFGFCAKHKKLVKLLVFLWLCNLNIVTIILEAIAFYFYFICSFKLHEVFLQLVKLLVDILIMLMGAPMIFWLIVAFIIFDGWRRSVGYHILQHHEMKNRGFINSLPVVSMACGTMGAKKTTLITDMLLSTEAMFRDKAKDLMFRNDMQFPNFPWQKLEDSIIRAIDNGCIYNLASYEKWVLERMHRHLLTASSRYLWGYDTDFFRFEYNDELKILDLWNAILTYGKLYFIYIMKTSLILSNYSVRTDAQLVSDGNFPLWNSDFFRSRPEERTSGHSHILDFDLLRLGKKIEENSKKSGALEFGVLGITEIGKERQNNLELKEMKKKDDGANQKNDLFNTWLKMSRHPAVVDNFTFLKIIADEQRPESWGADARDLCTIIDIMECEPIELVMPGFLFGDIIYDLTYEKFKNFYYEVRFIRGDNTLFVYFMKNIYDLFLRHYVKIYNTFGTMHMTLGTRIGSLDGEVKENDYYLAMKKIYANRFSTDCYAEFFKEKALASKWSLMTAPEYATERASVEELEQQNSYFIRDLTKTFEEKEE